MFNNKTNHIFRGIKRFLLILGIIFVTGHILCADSTIEERKTINGEAGLYSDFIIASSSINSRFAPTFCFYFGSVTPQNNWPTDEAAFLAHTGWAGATIFIYTVSSEQGPIDTENTENTEFGIDSEIRWVSKDFPVSITFPYSNRRMRWTQNDETYAILRYQTIGIRPGWFIRPDTEVSVGFSYTQPDLFYGSAFDYSYLAWDIINFNIQAKTVLELPNGFWITVEPAVLFIKDQQDNKLWAASLNAILYVSPDIGFGPKLSLSTVEDQSNAWSAYVRAIGVKEYGLQAKYNPFSWASIRASASYLIPEDPDVDSLYMIGVNILLRW